MRVLHTSDWHLGQRLHTEDRLGEQALALNWLLQTIEQEAVELLLVAGDIFDVSNPSNPARELYYRFLTKLQKTNCRHVVIVGGNHDSPSMLDAPASLLKQMNIHVIGAAPADKTQQIVVLENEKGQPEAIVVAVPFLRDRDLNYTQISESLEERERRLQTAIRQHYLDLAELLAPYLSSSIPILTTGHLYAHGATAEEKRSNIYIGSRSNIAAQQFPDCFDYVALGHIHRPQAVGNIPHIRYSGSLIPLDFSEYEDKKVVYLLDFAPLKMPVERDGSCPSTQMGVSAGTTRRSHASVEEPGSHRQMLSLFSARLDGRPSAYLYPIELPVFRRLKRIRGSIDEVKQRLQQFVSKRQAPQEGLDENLAPFLEVTVETNTSLPLLRDELELIMSQSEARLLALKLHYPRQYAPAAQQIQAELSGLDPEKVFRQLLQGSGEEMPPHADELIDSFRELQNWHKEKEGT